MRRGVPFGIAVFAIAISFGVLARPVMGSVAPIVMSVAVFSGAAQFGALAVLGAGGGTGAAIAAGLLLNARYLAMGLALAPSLRGRALSRAAFAMTTVDASWAAASAGDGTFDRWFMVGASIPQYVGWILGTVIGVLIGGSLGNPNAYGLDALFPVFLIALLFEEVHSRRRAARRDRAGAHPTGARRPADPGRGCGRDRGGEGAVTGVWIAIAALALGTAALKLAGPLLLGGRLLPFRVMSVVGLLASSLLAALVIVETFGQGRSLTLDARAFGALFAVVALARRAPLTVVVLGAAAVAALAHAIS
jgi:predicted branched-subunit amino acid permease